MLCCFRVYAIRGIRNRVCGILNTGIKVKGEIELL